MVATPIHTRRRAQRFQVRAVSDFQFQYHDGDEDGDHAITERFEAACIHRLLSLIKLSPSQISDDNPKRRTMTPLLEAEYSTAEYVADNEASGATMCFV
jgi:hypothetical protein